MIMIIIKVK